MRKMRLCSGQSMGARLSRASRSFSHLCVASSAPLPMLPIMRVTTFHRRHLRSSRMLSTHKNPWSPHLRFFQLHRILLQPQRPLDTPPRNCLPHTDRSASARSIAPHPFFRQRPSPCLHTSSRLSMSDADYEAFLNKANDGGDGGQGQAKAQSEGYGTKSVNTAVPRELENVQETYTSDADEPFEAVALNFDGDKLSARRWLPHSVAMSRTDGDRRQG